VRQLIQSVRGGELKLVEVPVPIASSTSVLVETTRSAVSPGTERSVRDLASASLLGKARARPDLVRQVLAKAKHDGIVATARAVRNKLDDVMPLGYSAVGRVIEVGSHVDGVRPGMRVATAGAGHGEYQVVAGLLVAEVPANVSDENAAFATIASVALHGLRLANVGPGSRVVVIGLGLLGQITCRLARASGCLVFGTDLRQFAVDRAREDDFAADVEQGADTTRRILGWSRGVGADAVIVTAGTSSSEPIHRAFDVARDRAEIVVIGAVGLELDRRPLYDKELSIRVARSYGPGRYDRSYEDWAVDYPIGYVRWTEGRNLRAVLDLMSEGVLDLAGLVTHEFDFARAADAYERLANDEKALGIQLVYQASQGSVDRTPIDIRSDAAIRNAARLGNSDPKIGVVGAGNFVRSTLLPALKQASIGEVTAICSASGVTARYVAESGEIPMVHVDASAMVADDSLDIVVIASPHSTHADLVLSALEAGKDVFCEKPLCLTADELDAIEKAYDMADGYLQVGFNRRYSPAISKSIEVLGDAGPLVVTYRVNAGELPPTHWYGDRAEGGRIIGEVCHFIDTACALAGDAEVTDFSVTGSGIGESQLEANIALIIGFANGTVAAITYGSLGSGAMAKERIEIVGGGHSVEIDDFKSLVIDGSKLSGLEGKGHTQQLTAFMENARGPDRQPINGLLASRLAIRAVEQLARTNSATAP